MMLNPKRLRSGRLVPGEPLMVPDTRPYISRVEDLVEEALSSGRPDGNERPAQAASDLPAEKERRP